MSTKRTTKKDDAADLRAELERVKAERDAALLQAGAIPTAAEDLGTLVEVLGLCRESEDEPLHRFMEALAALDRLTREHKARDRAVRTLEAFFGGSGGVMLSSAEAALALLRR